MTSAADKFRRAEVKKDSVPDVVLDPSSGKRYLKGRFLGKVILPKLYFVFLRNISILVYSFLKQC